MSGMLDVVRERNRYWPTVGRCLTGAREIEARQDRPYHSPKERFSDRSRRAFRDGRTGPICQIPWTMKIVYTEHALQDLSEIVSEAGSSSDGASG